MSAPVAARFFNLLYPTEVEGWLILSSKADGDNKLGPAGSFPCELAGIQAAAEEAVKLAEKGHQVWWAVCLQAGPAQGGRRGGESSASWFSGMWADLDFAKCNGPDGARQILTRMQVFPTVVIASGHGWHCYWLLDHMVEITEDNRLDLKLFERRWCATLRKHAKDINPEWSVDQVGDLARVMRVPGTMNRKVMPYQKVEIHYEGGPRYGLDELGPYATESATTSEDQTSSQPRSSTGRPSITSLLKTYGEWFAEGKFDGRNDAVFKLAQQLRDNGYARDDGHNTCMMFGETIKPFGEGEFNVEAEVGNAIRQVYGRPPRAPWGGDPAEDCDGEDEGAQAQAALAYTDKRNAERYVAKHGNVVLYCPAWGWLRWDGRHWADDQLRETMELAKRTVEDMYVEIVGMDLTRRQRNTLMKEIMKVESRGRLEGMIALAESNPRVARLPESFDRDRMALNVANGTIDLRTGDLREHRQQDLLTKLVPVEYDPKAQCPEWLSFLARVQPDSEVRRYIQMCVGYSLTGLVDEKCMFILYGGGDNGKSLFIEAILQLLGPYARTTSKQLIIGWKSDGKQQLLAELTGKRFVSFSEEVLEADKLNSGVIKGITGGESVIGRFLFKREFAYKPEMKLWLGTNWEPTVDDFGEAMKGRLHFITWPVRVPKDEQVKMTTMLERFGREGPGILTWAVEGCLAYQAAGRLAPPVGLELEKAEWFGREDTFKQWMDECLALGEGWAGSRELLDNYRSWALARGEDPRYLMGPTRFGKALRSRGVVESRTKSARGYVCSVVKTYGVGAQSGNWG